MAPFSPNMHFISISFACCLFPPILPACTRPARVCVCVYMTAEWEQPCSKAGRVPFPKPNLGFNYNTL